MNGSRSNKNTRQIEPLLVYTYNSRDRVYTDLVELQVLLRATQSIFYISDSNIITS
jgi:hypothetical protein